MGLRAIVMNKSEKQEMDDLTTFASKVLKERDASRRQVSDMEMQRATLVAEQANDRDKIISLMEDKVALLEEMLKLKERLIGMTRQYEAAIE
jgi:regulator of replication initiation timing